ncbi:SDR family oxidoreductase [Rhizobium tubonense]|uniref:Short-chain dehydrogenase n=1 Tax=Rhizobium tubonense TaxID=484088 RepID=A0A2W4CYI6_9HYPH|nr:SDR family oxidoreductase [Rhizobium tubonense]PZM10354.1 short-chain dehydrogenase [Rhizobium tubonense]
MSLQHVVIVGGSSGVGLATAGRLIGLGFKVTITGRDPARLRSANDSLAGAAQAIVMDGADSKSLRSGFAEIGSFDHLVLALSGARGGGPFASVEVAEVRGGFEQKVFPHFATAQTALPFLPGDGSITFVSAVSAQAAFPGTAGLAAANAAIEALVPVLAVELKPMRVNCVSPGVIDTPWWDFLPEDQKKGVFAEYAAKTPVGRVGQADDVAKAITFLISNGFMTGHTIVCDGGLRLAA